MQPIELADDSFCIAVLGDFFGNAAESDFSVDQKWEPRRATPDTVLKLLGLRPGARCRLSSLGEEVSLAYESLAYFGPDSIFERTELFEALREARHAAVSGPPPPQGTSSAEGQGRQSGRAILEAILDTEEGPKGASGSGPVADLDSFVRDVVRPHTVPSESWREQALSDVDQQASARMGELLHQPEVVALESLWRSLVFLLSRIDTSGKTRVFVLPVSRSALEQDLLFREDVRESRLFEAMSNPQLGVPGRRWAVAVGAFDFGPGPEDVGLLGRIAQVAGAAKVPWVSGAAPELAHPKAPRRFPQGPQGMTPGDSVIPEREGWTLLRQAPESQWVSLVAPRFLLRERYGREGLPCKAFTFEEPYSSRGDLLWGNGAFPCVALLAQAYAREGWHFHPSSVSDLDGMPLSPGSGGDDPGPSPLEAEISPSQADQLTKLGLVPLLSIPGQARIRRADFRSISLSRGPLRGGWVED